jgi:predicted nicotinamide N-methyase
MDTPPPEDLVTVEVALPGGPIRLAQPSDVAALPDDGDVKWAPIAPYWAVLWRSGVALARELAASNLDGVRLVELGCGLGLPSLAAARGGADVLAVDAEDEALALLERNARANGVVLQTLQADWAEPQQLLERAPFDLAIAADVLYEDRAPAQLAGLLPRLAQRVLIADPGRPGAAELLERAELTLIAPPRANGVVRTYELAARR